MTYAVVPDGEPSSPYVSLDPIGLAVVADSTETWVGTNYVLDSEVLEDDYEYLDYDGCDCGCNWYDDYEEIEEDEDSAGA